MSRMGESQEKSSTEQLTAKASEVGQNIREIGGQVRGVAQEKAQQIREQAEEYYQQGRDKVTEASDSLEGYVREKPLQSVLIAAGVGLLLGVLWKRS